MSPTAHAELDAQIAEAVQSYLSTSPFACRSLIQLSGGLTNYIYRGVLLKPIDSQTSVAIKHAAPLAAGEGFRDLVVDQERLNYEAATLRQLERLSNVPGAAIPRIFHHSESQHLFVCRDFGDFGTLKSHLCTAAKPDPGLGTKLGTFIATLHREGPQELREIHSKNDLSPRLAGYVYSYLVSSAEHHGLPADDIALLGTTAKEGLAELGTGDLVIHGDFWPGNIILTEGEGDGKGDYGVAVLDWEIARIGKPGEDLGQMTAELWEAWWFTGADRNAVLDVATAFLVAYKSRMDGVLEKKDVEKTIVRAAAHIMVWPRFVASYKDDVERVKGAGKIGMQWICAVHGGDWQSLRYSFWGCVIEADW